LANRISSWATGNILSDIQSSTFNSPVTSLFSRFTHSVPRPSEAIVPRLSYFPSYVLRFTLLPMPATLRNVACSSASHPIAFCIHAFSVSSRHLYLSFMFNHISKKHNAPHGTVLVDFPHTALHLNSHVACWST